MPGPKRALPDGEEVTVTKRSRFDTQDGLIIPEVQLLAMENQALLTHVLMLERRSPFKRVMIRQAQRHQPVQSAPMKSSRRPGNREQ